MLKIELINNKIKETVEYYKYCQIHSESSFSTSEFEDLKNDLLKDIDSLYIPQWKSTDPRVDINKFSRIIILRPSLYGHGHFQSGIGDVETKEGYYIMAYFDKKTAYFDNQDQAFINADDEWDPLWIWTYFPILDEVIREYQNG